MPDYTSHNPNYNNAYNKAAYRTRKILQARGMYNNVTTKKQQKKIEQYWESIFNREFKQAIRELDKEE